MSTVRRAALICLFLVGYPAFSSFGHAEPPGGWVETRAGGVREKWTTERIRSIVPSTRGPFTFPAPYHTRAARITDASDCPSGMDCLSPVGYSYWRNTNNHAGSNELLLFLSFDRRQGGAGPTLFRYDKTKETIVKAGPLFEPTSRLSLHSGDNWYFSATMPTTLYLNDGPKLVRYDVLSKDFHTVFDAGEQWGNDKYIWQMHSSNDDRVHSAALKIQGTDDTLGCLVYHETSHRLSFFGKVGDFRECMVDKSGHWLVTLENIDGRHGVDMRVFDLDSEREIARILDEEGAPKPADMGYGYLVGADKWNALPNATATWVLGQTVTRGPIVHSNINPNLDLVSHVSHANAKPGVAMEQQYACGSNAERVSGVQNEIACIPLDGSDRQMIVAPSMTSLGAPGGRTEYDKLPKGNLDITGEYFVWTTNLSGNRLEAFLVRIPSHLLAN
jgi:hypothetical protein